MADRAAPTPKNTGSNANTNAKKGDGDAWAVIVQGEVQRSPATRHDLNSLPPRRGTHLGEPSKLDASDLLHTDGL